VLIYICAVPEAPPAPPGEAHLLVDDDLSVVTTPTTANWKLEALAIGIVALVVAIPLRGLFRAPGAPMEEGFMLVFPERVLHGDVPNRDFLYLYGPGSLWSLAATYKVFGVSLWSQRTFALCQELAIVFGVFALARRWNRTLATVGAVCTAFVIIPFQLTALAWVGAVGLATVGLACGIAAYAQANERTARRWAIATGILLGVAITFRLDLVLAVGLAGAALLWRMEGARRIRVIVAFACVVLPAYLVQVAMAGIGNAWNGMVIEPVFHLRGGRGLPVPPSWSHVDGFLQKTALLQLPSWPIPAPAYTQQLFLWFFMLCGVVAFVLWQGIVAIRRDPTRVRARTLLVVGLFSLGMMPQAVQRVDSAHLAWVGAVPFGFLPVALYELVTRRAPRWSTRRVLIGACAAGLAAVLFVFPAFTITRYTDYAAQTFNLHRSAYKVTNDGRTFYYGKQDRADAAQMVLDAADKIAKPGQRLFVGPVNLRKTPYSDAWLYYMLPFMKPGTRYIEMDPGIANTTNSGLDRQLASSDLAILSSIWDGWDEPNDSRKVGSDKAERVLAEHFCLVGSYLDFYELYQRCR
jgi:hypothetical protein